MNQPDIDLTWMPGQILKPQDGLSNVQFPPKDSSGVLLMGFGTRALTAGASAILKVEALQDVRVTQILVTESIFYAIHITGLVIGKRNLFASAGELRAGLLPQISFSDVLRKGETLELSVKNMMGNSSVFDGVVVGVAL